MAPSQNQLSEPNAAPDNSVVIAHSKAVEKQKGVNTLNDAPSMDLPPVTGDKKPETIEKIAEAANTPIDITEKDNKISEVKIAQNTAPMIAEVVETVEAVETIQTEQAAEQSTASQNKTSGDMPIDLAQAKNLEQMSTSRKKRWFGKSDPIAPDWSVNPLKPVSKDTDINVQIQQTEAKASPEEIVMAETTIVVPDNQTVADAPAKSEPANEIETVNMPAEQKNEADKMPEIIWQKAPNNTEKQNEDTQNIPAASAGQMAQKPKISWVSAQSEQSTDKGEVDITESLQTEEKAPTSKEMATPKPQPGLWRGREGDKVKTVLENWSDKIGAELRWESDSSYSLASNVMIRGDFFDAIDTLITRGFGANGPLESEIVIAEDQKAPILIIRDRKG